MKITKTHLKQIIKEELEKVIDETWGHEDDHLLDTLGVADQPTGQWQAAQLGHEKEQEKHRVALENALSKIGPKHGQVLKMISEIEDAFANYYTAPLRGPRRPGEDRGHVDLRAPAGKEQFAALMAKGKKIGREYYNKISKIAKPGNLEDYKKLKRCFEKRWVYELTHTRATSYQDPSTGRDVHPEERVSEHLRQLRDLQKQDPCFKRKYDARF